jgi:hypothetical protein
MRSTQRFAQRNLLLAFDAFGTLFRPRVPVLQQYEEVARQHGLDGFTQQRLSETFRAAYKNEATVNPNYGRATGLGAEKWWIDVCRIRSVSECR